MDLIAELKKCGAIKNGEFTLKSGHTSTVYCDLRVAASHPRLRHELSQQLALRVDDPATACIAGVPLGGIPYACMVSHILDIPMVMVRDKRKDYGRQNLIEGDDMGRDYVLIEDVITTGGSVLETIGKLEAEGKRVSSVVAILDREVGGVQTLLSKGYPTFTLFKVSQLTESPLQPPPPVI